MQGLTGRTGLGRLRTICCALAVLLGAMTWGPSGRAWGRTSSWFSWFFDLFAGQDVSEPPALTAEDREAIEKARVLLESYDGAANSFMLGVFAAADGDAPKAQGYFTRAVELDTSESPLPLTMAARTYMQAGQYAEAKSLHQRALREGIARGQSPTLQKINAYLDLAVACSKLRERSEALNNARLAEHLLGEDSNGLPSGQKALGYLQLGSVYGDSIQDAEAARRAWQAGQIESAREPNRVEPAIIVALNVHMIASQPKNAPAAAIDTYVMNAEQAMGRLDEQSRRAVRTQLGEEIVRLAVDTKNTPEASLYYAGQAKRLLQPIVEMPVKDASVESMIFKARAIEAQSTLPDVRRTRGEVKRLKKERDSIDKRMTTEWLKSVSGAEP
jgi:hypothetical protein